jgi:hypothetical protein
MWRWDFFLVARRGMWRVLYSAAIFIESKGVAEDDYANEIDRFKFSDLLPFGCWIG